MASQEKSSGKIAKVLSRQISMIRQEHRLRNPTASSSTNAGANANAGGASSSNADGGAAAGSSAARRANRRDRDPVRG